MKVETPIDNTLRKFIELINNEQWPLKGDLMMGYDLLKKYNLPNNTDIKTGWKPIIKSWSKDKQIEWAKDMLNYIDNENQKLK